MRKPLMIGGGLGLLVLVLVVGGGWLVGKNAEPGAVAVNKAVRSDRASQQGLSGVLAPPAISGSAPQPRSSPAAQERRRRLAEVRAEFNALRAKGTQAPPEKMRALIDELEALSPPGFDPRYFQTLRNMLDASARIQTLNQELQGLSKSASSKDAVRQQAIVDEMRSLGERVGAEARNLQVYAPKPPSGVKTP
ncbi:hypothetical protein [Acidovorax sp. 69]|uniref:hypothetical protein n=1 Tax=Acidovorax sp. 69 TaxID=2035202 RepID=UPI000C24B599|nr:hypothetical protein [Acidovorax sp. 69]